jgi:hypothetical protein
LDVIPACDSCIYRNHFEFENDLSASQFGHELLQSKPNTTLRSKTVDVEVDASGNAIPPPLGKETAVDARIRVLLAIRKHAAPLPAAPSWEPEPEPEQNMEMEQPPPLE